MKTIIHIPRTLFFNHTFEVDITNDFRFNRGDGLELSVDLLSEAQKKELGDDVLPTFTVESVDFKVGPFFTEQLVFAEDNDSLQARGFLKVLRGQSHETASNK